MEGSLLLPLSDGLVIEQISQQAGQIIVSVRATVERLCCPVCDTASASMHSRYVRTIADLPHAGQKIILKLRVRRFSCRNPLCIRHIFTERLSDLVQPWAQMTNRLREALCALSLEASELRRRLGMKMTCGVS
ncbi:hypothetical protein KSF_104140 [Reticulibacter mediterranei]|uniref:Transposase IS204/IS1001/IS1096/IS1165 zinc-finger domain-containing protein n=1 Tax=Reticulibacter mediterranei TaxID=2778369 RepID=A0A8J3J2H4_9CHLR|nr:transposase family protein [Reticulibacter mediterranei]GHP00367.1 hypothetical protein KSF_104140 [Reticulibacter mediterranei]